MTQGKTEIKNLLTGVVDRILKEKIEKVKEQKRIIAEKKRLENEKVQKIKESLHKTLKDVKWSEMSIKEANALIENLKTWVKEVEKK